MRNNKSESIASIQSAFFVFGLTRNVFWNYREVGILKYKKQKEKGNENNNSNYLFITDL